MKVHVRAPARKGRIEIIPLIDIMFFLLAAFMLTSLSMIRLRSMQMALPTATMPAKAKPEVVNLLVSPDGDLYVGATNFNVVDLERFLAKRFQLHPQLQVYIKADPAAKYAMFIHALDLVRQAGIANVSCAISRPHAAKEWG